MEAADGNPFYLIELAAACSRAANEQHVQRGVAATVDAVSISRAVLRELDDRSDAATQFALAASVVGDPFDFATALAVSRLEQDSGLSSLDELVAVGLLTATDRPDAFRFRHPIVARAVYESIPAGTRMSLHQQAVTTLEAQGVGPVVIAAHVEASAAVGDEKAIDLLTAAAQEVRHLDSNLAARFAKSALGLIPERSALTQRRAEIIRLRIEALIWSDQHDQAVSELAAETRDVDSDPHTQRGLATLIRYLGIWLDLLGVSMTPERQQLDVRSRLWIQNATSGSRQDDLDIRFLRMFSEGESGQLDRALAIGDELVAAADELDLPSLGLRVLAVIGLWQGRYGFVDDATTTLSSAHGAFEALPPTEQSGAVDATLILASAELRLGNWERAAWYCSVAMSAAETTSNFTSWVLFALPAQLALVNAGRLDDARILAVKSEERARLLGLKSLLAPILAERAAVEAVAGDRVEAAQLLRRASAHSTLLTQTTIAADLAVNIGWAWMLIDDADSCLQTLAVALASPDFPKLGPVQQTMAFALGCWAEVVNGDHAAASKWASSAHQASDDRVVASVHWALRADISMAILDGDHRAAARSAAAAVDAARTSGSYLEQGIAGIIWGKQLAASGAKADAVNVLKQALDLVNSIGASRLVESAETELTALGIEWREEQPVTGDQLLPELSVRELEIARLVATGSTNAEIAAHLVLSVRTIETHLHHIFQKVGIKHRAELAALVEAYDLGTASST